MYMGNEREGCGIRTSSADDRRKAQHTGISKCHAALRVSIYALLKSEGWLLDIEGTDDSNFNTHHHGKEE
jgi:hypothetical protein